MNDMKCPMCNTILEVLVGGANVILGCPRCRYKATDGVWQELIRTRKALDVAVDALTRCQNNTPDNYTATQAVFLLAKNSVFIDKALDKITALEQKDK